MIHDFNPRPYWFAVIDDLIGVTVAFFSRKMNKVQVSFDHRVILVLRVMTLAAAQCVSLESSSLFVVRFFVLAR